jgi:putative tricarboxylic transport membrane protein
MIGQNPATGVVRYTGGWEYLGAGIQLIPLIAGLFGIPEVMSGFRKSAVRPEPITDYWPQLFRGFRDCVMHWREVLRGGFIGFVSGLLPGIGGSVGDIMAYGATVAKNPRETFGNGNIKGLLGCEGANNAQKASSMVPTVLFGIPGAPFAAIMMAICVYFGMELGTPETLKDTAFFWSLGGAFIASTVLAFFIAMFTTRIVVKLLEIPYWIYAVVILSIIVGRGLQKIWYLTPSSDGGIYPGRETGKLHSANSSLVHHKRIGNTTHICVSNRYFSSHCNLQYF